jgi:hypothetical protein
MMREKPTCFALDAEEIPRNDVLDIEDYDKLLDFELEKCHQALVAAAKLLSSAILTFSLFVTITVVLFFGASTETELTVPLIGIKVAHAFAVILSLLIMDISLWWSWSTILLIHRLQAKLWLLLTERFGLTDDRRLSNHLLTYPEFISTWHIQLPTLPTVLLDSLGEHTVIRYLLNAFWIVLSFVFPVYIAWNLGPTYPLVVTVAILFFVAKTHLQIFHLRNQGEDAFLLRRRTLEAARGPQPVSFTKELTLTSLTPKKAVRLFGKDASSWILLLKADAGLILGRYARNSSAMFIFLSEEAADQFATLMQTENPNWRKENLITKQMTLDHAIARARFEELASFVVTIEGADKFFLEYQKFLEVVRS